MPLPLPLPSAPEPRAARRPRRDRRVPLRTVGALSASVLAFPLMSGQAVAASPPVPTPNRPLPSALDVAPPYQKGTRCLTEAQPGAVAFAKLLNATYGKHVYGILRQCAAEHGEGRALDWMISAKDPRQLAVANTLTRWLSAPDAQGRPGAMARRFGINYIIFNRQMWRAYAPERGWAPYYGVSPHTDHIHFSFTWDGAYARTSWWTGTAVTTYLTGPLVGGPSPTPPAPPPAAPPATALLSSTGYPLLAEGASGAEVVLAQTAVGVTADGRFGPATAAALRAWQTANGIPATARLDNATWARLVAVKKVPARPHALEAYAKVVLRRGSTGAAVSALQKAIGGLVVDGSYGPATEARVKQFQTSRALKATGVTDTALWYALMNRMTPPAPPATPAPPAPPAPVPAPPPPAPSPAHPLEKYAGTTLRLWNRGPAVSALQKAVGKLTVDGSFGRLTETRVEEYQRAAGLPPTGVVDRATWNVLMGRPSGLPPATTPAAPSGGFFSGSTPNGATTAAGVRLTEFTRHKGERLALGSSGTSVRVLQGALGSLAVDGRFGLATQARVKAFQRSATIPATGVVDARTWDAIEQVQHPLVEYWDVVLRPGSTGFAVKALQRALRLTPDGRFGPSTEAAVKSVQRESGIAQTGVVATLTWRAVEARMPR